MCRILASRRRGGLSNPAPPSPQSESQHQAESASVIRVGRVRVAPCRSAIIVHRFGRVGEDRNPGININVVVVHLIEDTPKPETKENRERVEM